MKVTKLELGQYDCLEKGKTLKDDWLHRWVIHKIMPKTVDVSCICYWDGYPSPITGNTVYRKEAGGRRGRYDKTSLLTQINLFNNAVFTGRRK